MSWRDVPTADYILFLADWKSRQEIAVKFNLSNVESWHCVKFLSKLSEIQVIKGSGFTKRCILYKARCFALQEARESKSL